MILNRSSGWIARALAALSLTAACAAAFGGCSSELPSTDSDEREPVAGLMQAATIVDPGFTDTTVVTGISNPTAMAFAPDGRLFVAQQTGALRVVKNGALLATPFLTVPVDSAGERGLLGVTFDPNFGSNRLVYVYYTTTSGGDAQPHQPLHRQRRRSHRGQRTDLGGLAGAQ